MASMTGVNIVMGKVSISAGLMAALVRRSKRYDYKIEVLTDQACTLVFTDNGQVVYENTYTLEDAKRAGLLGKDMWQKYPKDMLFARCISNGARRVCPELVTGVYTPDELGLAVDEDGNAVNVQQPVVIGNAAVVESAAVASAANPAPTAAARQPTATIQNGKARPYTPDYLRERFAALIAGQSTSAVKDGFKGLVAHWLDLCYAGQDSVEQKRHSLTKFLTGKLSTNDLTPAELRAFKSWLSPVELDGGAWKINGMAEQEAQAVITQTMLDAGQQTLPIDASDDADDLFDEAVQP
jgi:hypothetical protein